MRRGLVIPRQPRPLGCSLLLACAIGLAWLVALPGSARAEEATWRLEQPAPPSPPPGVPPAPAPVGLGRVGAIAFSAPNRGVLITAGNPPTVPAGVWIYNGEGWRELAIQCGATDGRIAWVPPPAGAGAGFDEFWTISNGRPGEAPVNDKAAPIIDDTLCRFGRAKEPNGQEGPLKVLESFAWPADEADSYQEMHAAICLSREDCWFGGESLPSQNPEIGAFQLHWNGSSLTVVPFPGESHAIWDYQVFENDLYQSVRLKPTCTGIETSNCDRVVRPSANPPPLHELPEGSEGFVPVTNLKRATLYNLGAGEQPWMLEYLHLSAGQNALWAATGAQVGTPETPEITQATVLRYTPEAGGEWTQLLGPKTNPSKTELHGQTIQSIAVEPGAGESGEESAWLALQTPEEASLAEREQSRSSASARLVRMSASGALSREETLPSASEAGVGPKGAAELITCPAAGDCWMVTSEGWLFHLATAQERAHPNPDTDSGFEELITERPRDKGLPQEIPDSLPPNASGLVGEAPTAGTVAVVNKGSEEARVPVALVSAVRTKVIHGTTLELRFHLATKARVQLVARRRHRVVAKSPVYTFRAGTHEILLRLSRRNWPTELHLVEHALAPLPTVSANAGVSETVTTSSLAFPSHLRADALELP